VWAIVGAATVGAAEYLFMNHAHAVATLKNMALPMVAVPLFMGIAVTLGCGGASLQKRIVSAALAGVLMGILATGASVWVGPVQTGTMHLLAGFVWRVFLFALFAAISATLTEVFFPDRDGVL
jgi:hypothetical protein